MSYSLILSAPFWMLDSLPSKNTIENSKQPRRVKLRISLHPSLILNSHEHNLQTYRKQKNRRDGLFLNLIQKKGLLGVLKSELNMLANDWIIFHKLEFLTLWKILLLNWVYISRPSTYRRFSCLVCCFSFCHREYIRLIDRF